jgi:hypothetical protein
MAVATYTSSGTRASSSHKSLLSGSFQQVSRVELTPQIRGTARSKRALMRRQWLCRKRSIRVSPRLGENGSLQPKRAIAHDQTIKKKRGSYVPKQPHQNLFRALLFADLLCRFFDGSQASTADSVVPAMVKFTGTLIDADDKPLAGTQGVTFLLYKEQTGGAPLWMERRMCKPTKTAITR